MGRTDEVVDSIKTMILMGHLGPGDRLPVEKDLAATMGLSRGSLREGVRALTAMGVLTTRQGDGTYVTNLEPRRLFAPIAFAANLNTRDALHFLSVRRVLETEAAGLAAAAITDEQVRQGEAKLAEADALIAGKGEPHQRLLELDQEFHRVVAETAGNPVQAALLEALGGQTWRARLWRSHNETSVSVRTAAEHHAILGALRDHDAERARLRMAAHILGVEDFVRANQPPEDR